MNEFHCSGMSLFQIDSRNTAIVHLTPEFLEIHAPLVVDFHLRIERDAVARQTYARAHVYVLGEHLAEAAHFPVDGTRIAHVEGARHELLEAHLAAAYAA